MKYIYYFNYNIKLKLITYFNINNQIKKLITRCDRWVKEAMKFNESYLLVKEDFTPTNDNNLEVIKK